MPPTLVMSFVLGSLYGLVFFLLIGARDRSVLYFWLVGALGFLFGQIAGEYIHVVDITLGDVRIVEGSLVCWLLLFILYNMGPVKARRR